MLQSGADVTAVNSYAQTPLDLVGKLTPRSSSTTREIKLMLQGTTVHDVFYLTIVLALLIIHVKKIKYTVTAYSM